MRTGLIASVLIALGAVIAPPGSFAAEEGHDAKGSPKSWVRPLDRQGFHLGFPLATVIPMLTPMDTNGVFDASIEHVESDYYGPAHVHEISDETIIMTDGSAYVRLNDRDFTLTKGEWLFIPRGTVHSFKSTGSPAKWVIVKTPPAPPPRPPSSAACDRASFTPEMVADVPTMIAFYKRCLDDFYMIDDAGLPGSPYTPTEYEPGFDVRPWVRPLDRPAIELGFPAASLIPMLSADDTGGAFTGAIEHVQTDFYGPAHKHHVKSETIIMIDGSVRIRLDGTDLTMTEGQWLHIPAGIVHSFDSTGSPAKWIILQSPAPNEAIGVVDSAECDRSDFTNEMQTDPAIVTQWYHDCVNDFFMVPEGGLPGSAKGVD